jgi:hypothetical protein
VSVVETDETRTPMSLNGVPFEPCTAFSCLTGVVFG